MGEVDWVVFDDGLFEYFLVCWWMKVFLML